MRLLAAVALVACGPSALPGPQTPEESCKQLGGGAPSLCPQPVVVADASVDAPPVSQDEKLAAIQKAMNDLDEAAQACWASAATERYDIAGDFVAQIDIGEPTHAFIVQDSVRNGRLQRCLESVLVAYRWAPPLRGETIQLPFKFNAPDGQSVIDRRLVESRGQSSVTVGVLIDESNTGNAAASMFELDVNTTTGLRKTERAEVWYFLAPGTVDGRAVAAGDMLFVPAGSTREVKQTRAVVLAVPGGREGSARAGALPTASVQTPAGKTTALTGKQYGPATIFLDASIVKGTPVAASILELSAGATVAEHVHAKETELLYILEGSGTMTIAGQDIAITPTSVVQVPPNTKHAFAATERVRAVQFYTPPGPEQRFKK